MNILFDTHVLLWIAFDKQDKFSKRTLSILNDSNNNFYVSIATIWEIAIKSALKKPDFDVDVNKIVSKLETFGFNILPISIHHVVKVADLPLIHNDPFDRLLIVQAKQENFKLLTVDEKILKYQLDCFIDMNK